MHVQVNTDKNIDGRDRLLRQVELDVGAALARYSDDLTRVEVHVSDKNAAKGGADDKRCVLEARPAGQQPVAVTHHAASVEEAYLGALEKLGRLLESSFAKRH